MSEIKRYLYNELLREKIKLEKEAHELRQAAFEICARYVSSEFYSKAVAEIEKVYSK